MNIPSYKYPVGTKVLIIEAPSRAQDRCKHCNSWINYKPTYQIKEVLVDQVSVYVYKQGSRVSYHLTELNAFTMVRSGIKEEEVFATLDEATKRIKELEAEWETLHSS